MSGTTPKRMNPYRVGTVLQDPDGWAVKLHRQAEPWMRRLASRSEAHKLLYAIAAGWASITVTVLTVTRGAVSKRVPLTGLWRNGL